MARGGASAGRKRRRAAANTNTNVGDLAIRRNQTLELNGQEMLSVGRALG